MTTQNENVRKPDHFKFFNGFKHDFWDQDQWPALSIKPRICKSFNDF